MNIIPSANAAIYNGSYYLVGGNAIIRSPDGINWGNTTAISNMSTINNFAWNTPYIGTPVINRLVLHVEKEPIH